MPLKIAFTLAIRSADVVILSYLEIRLLDSNQSFETCRYYSENNFKQVAI